MTNLVTQELLKTLVQRADADQVIGRALVALFYRQTEDEKATASTNTNNSVGFTGADAKSGVLTAKYFLKNGTLLDWMIDKWRKPASNGYPRIAKYWKQLDEIAQAKAAGTYVVPVKTVSQKLSLADVTTELETWVKSKAAYFDSTIAVDTGLVNRGGKGYNRIRGTNFSGLKSVVIDAYGSNWFRVEINEKPAAIINSYTKLKELLNEEFP